MRTFIALALLLLLQGCKHPLAIQGQGDIVDLNGNGFGCTLEQFQAGNAACENDVQGDYLVNYSGVPRAGWNFSHWDGACGRPSVAPNCRFDAAAPLVTLWDADFSEFIIPPLTAVFVQNAAPAANAGPNQDTTANLTVSLNGGGSDTDGEVVGYSWTQISGPSVSLTNASQANAIFIAPEVSSTTTLVFRLTVTDDEGATASDDTAISVMVDISAVVDLYNATCAICHRRGRFGAPRALTSDWNSRVPRGINALVSSVINGRGAMPRGGRCSSCSRDDYIALISYMSQTSF